MFVAHGVVSPLAFPRAKAFEFLSLDPPAWGFIFRRASLFPSPPHSDLPMATPPCPRPWLAPEVAVPLPDAGPPPNHRPRRGPSPGLAHGCGLLAAVLAVGALAAQPHGYARWLLRHDPNPTVPKGPPGWRSPPPRPSPHFQQSGEAGGFLCTQ